MKSLLTINYFIFNNKIKYILLPIRRAATINVGAGQYMSNNWAMTILPIIPPSRAATIEIAIPVARKFVGNTSVIRQSNAALPQLITPLKNADTITLCTLL